jgi:hypothetical protein
MCFFFTGFVELGECSASYSVSSRSPMRMQRVAGSLRSHSSGDDGGNVVTPAICCRIATQFERLQSLLTWRDPRVTAIFMLFLLLAAAVAYFVPYKKLLVAMAGFYIMRHPRLRRRRRGTKTTPYIITNFFLRLPSKRDELM